MQAVHSAISATSGRSSMPRRRSGGGDRPRPGRRGRVLGDAKRWRTLKVRARTYRTLRKQHLLSVSRTPCEPGTDRGVFRAMLRNSAGGLVSTNVQKLGNLHVLPGCVVKY